MKRTTGLVMGTNCDRRNQTSIPIFADQKMAQDYFVPFVSLSPHTIFSCSPDVPNAVSATPRNVVRPVVSRTAPMSCRGQISFSSVEEADDLSVSVQHNNPRSSSAGEEEACDIVSCGSQCLDAPEPANNTVRKNPLVTFFCLTSDGADEACRDTFSTDVMTEVEKLVTIVLRHEIFSDHEMREIFKWSLKDIRSLMKKCSKSRLDVAAKFMESLIELIDRRNMESGSPKEAARALKTVIKALTRPVLRDVVKRDQRAEELACLAGFAAGLSCRNGSCLLREKADVVLSVLYAGDDELFNKDGYSVVSHHAILFFDDCMNGKATSDVITELGFDREQLEVGWRCVADYVAILRELSG